MSSLVESVIPSFVNGVSLGLNIGLVALALALIWRIVGMIDFGLGAVYLMVGYAIIVSHSKLQWSLPVSIAAACVIGVVSSVAFYLGVYRYFLRRGTSMFILVAVGMSVFVAAQNFLGATFTAQKFYFVDELLPGWHVLGTRLNVVQIGKMVITLLALGTVALFCLKTRTGSSMLAVADNPELAQGVGISVDRAYLWTFGVAGLLVSAAAIPDVAETGVDPFIAFNPIFLALAAIIIGGLGTFRSPVFGAVLLGVAVHLAVWAFPSTWQEVIAYGVVVAVLVARPKGIFGGVQRYVGRT